MDRPPTTTLWRDQLLIVLAAGLVFFTNLGAAALFDEDEPKNAVCGREMFQRGDWIVPTFNYELRTDKPILVYWLMLSSYTVFGVSEFAARFGSSILAVGTSLWTYHLGRKLFQAEVGLWGALVLCTCLMFAAVGRSVTPDSTLIFCTTAAFVGYVWATAVRHGGRFGNVDGTELTRRPWEQFVPATWLQAVPMYVAMGFAVLAKGPIGVLLPCTILGLFLLIRQQLDHRLDAAKLPTGIWWRRTLVTFAQTFSPARIWKGCAAMRVPMGALIVAAIALPWYVTVGIQTDGAWLEGFLGGHNVGRFLKPMENHRGPFVYYIPVILLGTLPWSVFLPLAIWRAAKRLSMPGTGHAADLFLLVWAGAWVGFFSIAKTKLPNYVLPAYPALALLMGGYLTQWRREAATFGARGFRNACRIQAVVGAAILVGFPIAASYILPDEWWLAMVGLWPLIGAGVAYQYVCQHQRLRAVRTLAITAVALAVTVVGICPAWVARHQDGLTFGRFIQSLPDADEAPLATYEYFAPNLVFYAERKVHRLKKPQIAEFFTANPQGLLLTRDDRLDQLATELPDDIAVLTRQRRFLRQHNLVLLGRGPQTVQPASHTITR
ncbi:MAG TPA: glycosyltransferase family 39 protein [Planctomycetaceae bacterium]|nr:glycosyltransferase family 39 protein [Planctomycetaceae bacterium]